MPGIHRPNWFNFFSRNTPNIVTERNNEAREQQGRGGRQATAWPPSAATSAPPSSTRRSYPPTNLDMPCLVLAQKRLENFKSAGPKDQIAMLCDGAA